MLSLSAPLDLESMNLQSEVKHWVREFHDYIDLNEVTAEKNKLTVSFIGQKTDLTNTSLIMQTEPH